MRFTAIQHAPDRLIAVIIKHQVRMSPGTLKPALDAILILLNGFCDRMLGACAISISGRCRNVALAFEPLL